MRTGTRVLAVLVLFRAPGAWSSPAMIAPGDGGDSRAERSFSFFAEEWIGRAVARGARDSKAPRAHPRSDGLVFTYRAVDEQFVTELRPTGRPSSPYFGVLHYTEHLFTCEDVRGAGGAFPDDLDTPAPVLAVAHDESDLPILNDALRAAGLDDYILV